MVDLLKKTVTLCIAFGSAVYIPKVGWDVADTLMVIFNYTQFSVGWDLVHHTVQALLPLLIIAVFGTRRKNWSDWGFNVREKENIKFLISRFIIGFIVFFTIGKILYIWLSDWPMILDFEEKESPAWEIILFRLTMPGLSEEFLFRSFIMTILMMAWKGVIQIGKVHIPIAGLISACLFAVAHIGFTMYPLQITYYNPLQLVFAFLFGIYYAIVFYETKSIVVPIITHNCIDGVGTLIDYLFVLVFYH